MSAPDTNVKEEQRKHKPAIIGIKGAMIWGALMIALLVLYNIYNAGEPDAVTVTDQAGTQSSTVPTDTYEPGTNSTATPTDPNANVGATD